MTGEDEREEAAWGGRKLGSRTSSISRRPNKPVEITGNLPDFNKMGLGLAGILAAIALLGFAFAVAFPEMNNLNHADLCAKDCFIGKAATSLLGFGSGIAGIACAGYGVITLIESLGILNENTIRAKIRELS